MTDIYRRYYQANQQNHVGALAMLATALVAISRSTLPGQAYSRDDALRAALELSEMGGFMVISDEFHAAGVAFDAAERSAKEARNGSANA